MQKLILTSSLSKIYGKEIDYTQSYDYHTSNYFNNEYGEYVSERVDFLSNDELKDVLNQKSLAKRIKRIHHYFKDAKYISYNVIDIFNTENEDIFESLQNVIVFD